MLCAVLPVTNVGNATAAAVPQLYLEVESGLGLGLDLGWGLGYG